MPIMRFPRERKTISLAVGLKDFGPISSGKMTFQPLTVLIGPNNSGKSYAAMLTHAILQAYSPIGFHAGIRFLPRERFWGQAIAPRPLSQDLIGLVTKLRDLQPGQKLEIPSPIIAKTHFLVLKDIYEKRLTEELVRLFGPPLRQLLRFGGTSLEVEILSNSHEFQLQLRRTRLQLTKPPQMSGLITIVIGGTTTVAFHPTGGRINVGNRWLATQKDDKKVATLLAEALVQMCAARITEMVPSQCYYLPAARSGILQAHKALAESILRGAPFAGIERFEVPKLSGIVSEFISDLITLPEDRGPFYRLAQEFERYLIKGEIITPTSKESPYPEIKYRFKKMDIPLPRASSTVSELAPLLLFLKYLVKVGDLLIIEEPEAHLHPANQRILARLLVMLIRRGLNIIITTHSEHLLEQLSAFVMLEGIVERKRVDKYKYDRDAYLRAEEVAVYLFEYDESTASHRIKKIEVTQEDGIAQEEFTKIHEALSDELIMLRIDLEKPHVTIEGGSGGSEPGRQN